MQPTIFVDSAKVMAKGQVTIPKDIRNILGISAGNRLSFIVENDEVRILNSTTYAIKHFQSNMKGIAENSGLNSEEDVMDLITEMRKGN